VSQRESSEQARTGTLRHSTARLRRFALRRIVQREFERRNIAQTLHDDLGQMLSALNLGLYRIGCRFPGDKEHLALVDDARALLEEAARSARRLAAGFRPSWAEPGNLHAVLLSTVERFQAEFGRQCLTRIGRDVNHSFDRENAIAVQSLLLLGLAATARHGLARLPVIHAGHEADMLILEIRDQRGATEAGRNPRTSGAGHDELPELAELHEWLLALGGELRLGTSDDRFLLRIEVPLPD
jgi:signal transduction histidine kinase